MTYDPDKAIEPEVITVERVEPLPEAIQHKARLTAGRYATDADDLRQLLEALGLAEQSQRPSCRRCELPFSNTGAEGTVRRHAQGMCGSCYQRERATKPAVPAPPDATRRCLDCGSEMHRRPRGRERRADSRGRCHNCYQRIRRQEKRDAEGQQPTTTCACGAPTYMNRRQCGDCRVLVPAKPVQEHLTLLRAVMPLREIAESAGVPVMTLRAVGGWKRISADDAERICAVPLPEAVS